MTVISGQLSVVSTRAKTTSRRMFVWLLATVLLTTAPPAQAQQPKKIHRIGYLGGSAATNPTRIAALRKGLGELGYVEGKNIVVEIRLAEGKQDRERALAVELA